jgi:hypothetical protein
MINKKILRLSSIEWLRSCYEKDHLLNCKDAEVSIDKQSQGLAGVCFFEIELEKISKYFWTISELYKIRESEKILILELTKGNFEINLDPFATDWPESRFVKGQIPLTAVSVVGYATLVNEMKCPPIFTDIEKINMSVKEFLEKDK